MIRSGFRGHPEIPITRVVAIVTALVLSIGMTAESLSASPASASSSENALRAPSTWNGVGNTPPLPDYWNHAPELLDPEICLGDVPHCQWIGPDQTQLWWNLVSSNLDVTRYLDERDLELDFGGPIRVVVPDRTNSIVLVQLHVRSRAGLTSSVNPAVSTVAVSFNNEMDALALTRGVVLGPSRNAADPQAMEIEVATVLSPTQSLPGYFRLTSALLRLGVVIVVNFIDSTMALRALGEQQVQPTPQPAPAEIDRYNQITHQYYAGIVAACLYAWSQAGNLPPGRIRIVHREIVRQCTGVLVGTALYGGYLVKLGYQALLLSQSFVVGIG